MSDRPDRFGLEVDFDADRTVVALRGDLDLLAGPALGAFVASLVDRGHTSVVFDLAELGFLGAAGIGVIAETAAGLAARRRETGGRLVDGAVTVRSASPFSARMLDASGLGDLVTLEAADPDVARLGAEQRTGDRSGVVDGGSPDLAGDLVRVGSIPASSAVIDGTLRLVTALASQTVEGADGVSVSLARHGRLSTVAASDETIMEMDDHQYGTGEGPCIAAAAEGHWFHIESLAEERRWPAFVPLAREQGISSILSTPLMAHDRPVGALNIYSNTERAFGPRQQELAALFATQASAILAEAGADSTDSEVGERIHAALSARTVIAQAQGVLMARDGLVAEAAAAELHRSARAAATTVERHAGEVIASTTPEGGRAG